MLSEIIRLTCIENGIPSVYAHSYYANQGLLLANDGDADLLVIFETPMLGKDTYHNRPALIEGGDFLEMKELTMNGGKSVVGYVFEFDQDKDEIALYMTNRFSNQVVTASVVRVNRMDREATISRIDYLTQRGLYDAAVAQTSEFMEEVYAI